VALSVFGVRTPKLVAQQSEQHAPPSASDTTPPPLPPDAVTHHEATIGGEKISYTATAGTITLRDEEGKPTADVFYVAYTRDGVSDRTARPVTFAYNGGPGSASLWMHLGALGPRRVVIPDTSYVPPPPYRTEDNASSLLDVTDLVFIDPVGTGYSRPRGQARGKDFWGVDEDARSVGQFIRRYVTRNDRWNSPRYLMGESYGTTRSAALVRHLQSDLYMDFNGVILVSEVLDFQTIAFTGKNDLPYVLYLPTYAATSWYHHALPGGRPAELEPFLREVEDFASGDYAHALMAGSALPDSTRRRVIARLQDYTGLSRDYLDRSDLRVDNSEYEQELLNEKGIVIGRLDSRYTGPTVDPLAQRVYRDPQSDAVSSAFASVFRQYVRQELHFDTERRYEVIGNVGPWNWDHGRRGAWPGFTEVSDDLADAMEANPHLRVLLFMGYFDLATPYFASVYTMNHLGLPPELRSNIREERFMAGHMMYVHSPSLRKMKEAVADFMSGTGDGST